MYELKREFDSYDSDNNKVLNEGELDRVFARVRQFPHTDPETGSDLHHVSLDKWLDLAFETSDWHRVVYDNILARKDALFDLF